MVHRRKRGWFPEILTLDKDCFKGPIDIAFVFDASSSVWNVNFTKAQKFVTSFIDPFYIGPHNVRVGIMMYADKVYTEPKDVYYFINNQNKADVDSFIANLEWHAGLRTETGLGIQFMRENIMSEARTGVRKICIVITDGESQDSKKTAAEAKLARDAGIQMMAVGVSKSVNENELNRIAGDPSQVYIVETYDELDQIKEDLFGKACEKVSSYYELRTDLHSVKLLRTTYLFSRCQAITIFVLIFTVSSYYEYRTYLHSVKLLRTSYLSSQCQAITNFVLIFTVSSYYELRTYLHGVKLLRSSYLSSQCQAIKNFVLISTVSSYNELISTKFVLA
ncbi:hypothetical protein LOTGIDRAFT_231504 [Lottia gigantea]|uniref:VWFA domain-containing protein n=1 Tax=Lottia gigantea TaxID=225164 RepID=V4C6K7_LOTGI|nr:hypothetical protein LOTGIDRAFT_231504 [Lottia gigantea]ESO97299.1 hypothetical protein LOTGIDRAFT_231504 [Lottia gigantea]